MPSRVLVVEDDDAVRRALAGTLREEGYLVEEADSAERALAVFRDVLPDIVLSDVRMPGADGLELLRLLRARGCLADIVLMTAFDSMEVVARAMRDGAFDFLVKPLDPEELLGVMRRVEEDRRARERRRRSVEADRQALSIDSLVGRDPRMIEVYKRVGQLAANRVSALLRGETGTGKGRVARAIHYTSEDADAPFVAVNCTALPESLLESELFGHVRGAFTGAVRDRRGRFALAGRGTIFLDEVGDTSLEFQARLLRVLENGEYYPVGADTPDHTAARVLAATHRDLEDQVRQGRFREDLYYRLRIVEVLLPPLRDRGGDLLLLARHFVEQASQELHRERVELSPAAIHTLESHDWPGNVRELENCITRAVVVASGGVIHPRHLGLSGPHPTPGRTAAQPEDSFPTLAEVEAAHVRRALVAAAGNRTRAARLLGVSKPTVYRMMKKHGIS